MTERRGPFWRRFRRDKVGVASATTLFLMALACYGSLLVAPHPYNAVYLDYVMTAPSLVSHPSARELDAAIAAFGARAHATASLAGDGAARTLHLASSAPIDTRVLRYLDRSDVLRVDGTSAKLTSDRTALTDKVMVIPQTFFFGTDTNGRDLLTRILVAGRISLAIGALASAVALGIGVVYGAIAGYVGGRTDGVMMRVVDIAYAMPFVFLVIVLLVFFGRSLWLLFVAIGAVEWLDMARIIRGQTLSLKNREFVLAAEALGESGGRIIVRHIVPNMTGPIVAYLALLVPRVILAESFLSFLGLGIQEPLTSWGILIADGARQSQGSVHLLVFPALALAITVVAANQLGEAILRAANAGDK